jgi:nitrogen regulatory protein PII
MALTSQITARYFTPIGMLGQTSGFIDFTAAELAGNGNIQTITRTFEFEAINLSGVTNPNVGMELVVDITQILAEDYLDTVFTDATKTYDAKIYITNVKRLSTPISGVTAFNSRSPYVDRYDNFYVDVRMNISVS